MKTSPALAATGKAVVIPQHSQFRGVLYICAAWVILALTGAIILREFGYTNFAGVSLGGHFVLALVVAGVWSGDENYIGISWIFEFFLAFAAIVTWDERRVMVASIAVALIAAINLAAYGALHLRKARQ